MREVNFSIPSANKASVGITTALYDRRALDCTSLLPQLNSLSHLQHLTTSSPRIREILTADGGLERLVSMVKNGCRTKDVMETWKWNLAFQCIVNIGVRGSDGRATDPRASENIRTRVVEADMVPVVATILDNYMQVLERARAASVDAESKRSCPKFGPCKRPFSRTEDRNASTQGLRVGWIGRRREPLPPIQVLSDATPDTNDATTTLSPTDNMAAGTTILPPLNLPPLPARPATPPPMRTQSDEPPILPSIQMNGAPMEDIDGSVPTPTRLPSMVVPSAQYESDTASQSQSSNLTTARPPPVSSPRPSTPMTPSMASLEEARDLANLGRITLRRARLSNVMQADPPEETIGERTGFMLRDQNVRGNGLESRVLSIGDQLDMVEIGEMEEDRSGMLGDDNSDGILDAATTNTNGRTAMTGTDMMDTELLDMTQRAMNAGMDVAGVAEEGPFEALDGSESVGGSDSVSSSIFARSLAPEIMALGPRDEDVIMALQLLAYVSKYCNLRPYFQQSHLVPKLRIGPLLAALDEPDSEEACAEVDNEGEFLQKDDYNIFPLVEKFTVKHHEPMMKYWAGVVMRNLCRKDKTRDNIRQCAYYKCGRWEEFARQFAKCRRCRQTKYCSKDCQKAAWPFHRYWCQPATPASTQ